MSKWSLSFNDWKPDEQPLREALCTLGNGYFCTRGAAEESEADDINYPGTYLAGGYNRRKSKVAGKEIENEDLVNWPNWLKLTFRHSKEKDWFNLTKVEVQEYTQEIDLKQGMLIRTIRFKDSSGRRTKLICKRIVSMYNIHVAAIQWTILPENWSGDIVIHAALDGSVQNTGVKRYRELESQHLKPISADATDEGHLLLVVETNQSEIKMAQAAKLIVYKNDKPQKTEQKIIKKKDYIAAETEIYCSEGKELQVEKLVTIFTSNDFAISTSAGEVQNSLKRLPRFERLLFHHTRSWGQLWNRCNITIKGNKEAQRLLRFHIFHLLQTVSHHTADIDAGVPARGWHGEAYRGHIFWDEIYIFPFLNLRMPEITRELLMYRYRRLPEARRAASAAGYNGAMFPWQSGSNGREESQVIHLNPESGNWLPDNTYLQRHINSAIAYNVWQYYEATHDREFMDFFGAEMIMNIAIFWCSIATWSDSKQRYEINNIVGPDEYHTAYPGSDKPGINNNSYTNIMAVWVLQCAIGVIRILDDVRKQELFENLGIDEKDVQHWEDVSSKMYVHFNPEGIISQFEGYDELEELDWKKYHKKHGKAIRLDRILESEGDSVERYKANKQADVIMLFYLFSAEELQHLFKVMNYEFDPAKIPETIEYYESRTSHGSTLSRLIHSWVLARGNREASWEHFEQALVSDLEDVQGGTTAEGIHLGAMAGTVDIVQRCFTGLEIRDNVLWLNPLLPEKIRKLKLNLRYRAHWLTFTFTKESVEISVDRGLRGAVRLGLKGEVFQLQNGEERKFDL